MLWSATLAWGADWGAQPSGELNRQLPSWLRFKAEYRARFEALEQSGFEEGRDDRYLLNRVRLGLTLQPRKWLTAYGEAQDSRVFWPVRARHQPPLEASLDLRLAYLLLGAADKGLSLQVGRQELAYDEERLLGAANWGNLGRSFNAVRLRLRDRRADLDVFASSVVVPVQGAWDRSLPGDNLHGAYLTVPKLIPRVALSLFSYWRVAPTVRGEFGSGKASFTTTGTRTVSPITRRANLTTMFAVQRGTFATDDVRALAAFARLRYQLGSDHYKPTLVAETNFASGDGDPRDRLRQTFDILYPTPHDKYGLADQVGWRNIRHLGATFELTPRTNLLAMGRFHTWWLHSATDGLYNANGALLIRDPLGRSGRHVGEELDVQVVWTPFKSTQIAGGIGHIFPGDFIRRAGPGRSFTFCYLSLTRSL